MFNNRKIVKKLADSVRRDLEHQSQVDKTLFRYQQGQDQRRQDADDQKNADFLARRSSNSKQRSKSRIAAGFNPETGQAYPASQDDLDDGQIQSRPRSTRQFTATNRKIQQNLTDSDDENEREEFMLPISKEEFQEEFDVDEETELQYPTQPYLTGENLLDEYSEELNISSSNSIRTAQQSQQRLPVPVSPQVSRLPIISSHQQQQHQKRVSQEYQQPSVPPLIPRSRSYNSNSPQSQSLTFDPEQNPQQQQQLYKNKTPVVSIEKTKSNADEKYAKRSQQVRRNSSAISKSVVRTDEQQEQEVDDGDVAEGELADDTNPYIQVRNGPGSNSVSPTNIRSKYERELPQKQQQQSLNTLTKVVTNRSNPILDSNVLSQREKESRRNSRRPSMVTPRLSDSDQDREYRDRDSQNSNFKGRNQGGDLSYTPSMVSRPNSNYSLTNQLQQELSISSRDVIPLPIEIPDSVTDADAFRRYLSRNTMESLGRNSIVGVGSRVGSQQISSEQGGSGSRTFASGQNLNDNNRRQDSFQQQQQEQQPYGQPPCFSYRQDTDCQNKAKFQSRTASLSHAIMTLALLSASAAQLRFVVAYSHAHSYPTLNYFLICSCIIIEVLVGIGFVILARFDFSEAFQDKLHSYLIFGLFVVTVANVIVAAFALDDHICEVLMKRSLPPIDPQFQLDNAQMQINGLKMYNRRPQQPPPQRPQPQQQTYQFRSRAPFPNPARPPERQPQGLGNFRNPSGFTPSQRMTSSSGPSSHRVLASGGSGVGSYNHCTSSLDQNSNQNRNQSQQNQLNKSNVPLKNVPAPAATSTNDFDLGDDVWGDDDDDMDMFLASQAVEAATPSLMATNAVGSTVLYSSQPPSSLNQHGVRRDQNMPLHMIRYELALKESKTNGEEVRMEDFMTDGVLGGVIASSTSGIPKEKSISSGQQIAELKKTNEELKSENYSCKGEVANLRRLLEKNQKERQKDMVNRVNQEKDKQKMEKEEKDRVSKDLEKIKTDLRYKENDVRELSLKIVNYKKQIESLNLRLSSQIGSLPNASASRTSSSNSFPNRSSFHSRETPTATPVQVQLPSLSPTPTVKIESKTIDVQTDQTIPPETANDVARKAWAEAENCRQLILSVYLERIIVKTSKDTALLIPVFESIADKAQNEIILNLKNEGFRYEFMFPDNLKLAEFKLDEKERNLRNKTKPVIIPKLPIEYKDWDGIDGLDVTIRNCLLQYQGDIWAGISHVGEDLIRRINFMRQGNPNSLYQSKNFVHFMKLLIWGRHLWKSFYPSFCQHWKTREEPRQFFLEDIKKWTACVLWIGNRCFEVVDARTELRKLVLKILVSLAKNSYSCFHYTEANYLGVYKFIFYTLTINRHLNFENFYRCLQLSGALGRKKFYLKYMCVNRKDKHACLAYQFATLGLSFFTKEKDISKKFKLYKAYLDLLDAMREWCVVHPQCAAVEDTVQTDDPDSSTEHSAPVFVVRRKEVTKSGSVDVDPSKTNNENETSRIDLDVQSFYHYGSEDFDTSISFIDLSDESQLDRKAQELSKCNRATNLNPKVSNSEFPFKKPKIPPSSHWPPHLRNENLGDVATPGSSAKAVRGSPAMISDFDCMMDVDPQTTTFETGTESIQSNFEVYEDEWDATEKEASTFNDVRAENTSVSNVDLPCRKFLDCSLWEEMKDGPRVGLCQCRCRLMETFMRMTEEVIQFWRFLKICSEYKKSTVSSSEWEAEKREEDFEILLEKIKNIEQGEEKRLGVVKSDDDFRDEHYISPDLPFWKRLMRDVKYTPPKLTPEGVGHALEKAVDIMSNSFITTQYNAFTAFGSDGANSFQVAVAYLLHYLSDLNFCPDTVRQVHYLSSSDTTGLGPQMNPPELEFMEGAHYSWAKNILRQSDHNLSTSRQHNPSGLSSFNVEFELENLPKFDPKSDAIVSRMPKFLVTSLLDLKQRKVEARKFYAQAAGSSAFDASVVDNSSGQDQCDDVVFIDISSPDPPHQEENEVEEENVEMQHTNATSPTASESECDSEDDQNVSDEWLTTDESAEESDSLGDSMESGPSVLPPKPSSKYKVVDDFKSFCSPAVEDSKEFLDILSDSENDEGDGRFPTITFSRLSGYFQKKKKNQQGNNEASNSNLLCEYKSAQSICDELSNTENFNIKSPDLEGGILQDSDAVEENSEHGSGRSEIQDKSTNSLIQIAMATLNRRKYYCEDETRDLWDDYNVNPSRVDV